MITGLSKRTATLRPSIARASETTLADVDRPVTDTLVTIASLFERDNGQDTGDGSCSSRRGGPWPTSWGMPSVGRRYGSVEHAAVRMFGAECEWSGGRRSARVAARCSYAATSSSLRKRPSRELVRSLEVGGAPRRAGQHPARCALGLSAVSVPNRRRSPRREERLRESSRCHPP